jgi:hypothetical protein
MEALLVCRHEKGRPRRISWAQGFAFGAYLTVFALALAGPANAQSRVPRAPDSAEQQQNARRARSIHANRADLLREPKRDYAENLDGQSFGEGHGDIGLLESRIRELADKVRELTEHLQRQKDQHVHAQARPMRFTLLERHGAPVVPKTYGEALPTLARQRARSIRAAFGDPEQRRHLAIDPEPAEVDRLLEPVSQWLDEPSTPSQMAQSHLTALVYLTLLETRAKIAYAEPLPAIHKLLSELRIDRLGLADHLHHSYLLDQAPVSRDLFAVLAATASKYPEPSSARDFLKWVAQGVAADLEVELLRKAARPYRGDPAGQFEAASENATFDNGAVLKLQIELQRMLVEAKALRATRRVDDDTAGTWEHRLLSAERELDRALRAADSEREAVMTLARRVPIERPPIPLAEQIRAPLPVEPPERLASDDLTTQH